MMQLSTGLHSVLNSLNNKGKVTVDGTPKDAVCRLYFSIQLNQLQLAAERSDQETKGRMHWQRHIERYHPEYWRTSMDVCPALCFSPYDTIADQITAPTFSSSLQTSLECWSHPWPPWVQLHRWGEPSGLNVEKTKRFCATSTESTTTTTAAQRPAARPYSS